MSNNPWNHTRNSSVSDDVDFEIKGQELQFVEIELDPGEELHVDTGCVAAFTSGIDFDVTKAGSIKSMIFGGEGVFFARLRGPGKVWIQSLPFSRLAGRMMAAAGPRGGQNRGEGSLLGGLGDMLDGA
jgi:uncharacterized protein (AIM24 family)